MRRRDLGALLFRLRALLALFLLIAVFSFLSSAFLTTARCWALPVVSSCGTGPAPNASREIAKSNRAG